MDHELLLALAKRQHGLVTRRQALARGTSDRQLDRLVSTAAWSRDRRGVYAIGAAPDTWERRVMAAVLAAGPEAVVSHRSTARLAGLVDRSGPVQISSSSPERHRLRGVRSHQSVWLPPTDRTTIHAIPTTTIERAIVDLSTTQGEATLARWVDHGLRTHVLDLATLHRCAERLRGQGREHPVGLRAVLATRLPGYTPGDSDLEGLALTYLREGGLPEPAQQHRVIRPGGRDAFIDLAYPSHLVGIELDGWEFHGQRKAFDDDRERRNDLTLLGWKILNFTSTTTARSLVATVRGALGPDRAA